MNIMRDKNLVTLRRQFEEDRARVWADEAIPLGYKQAEVDRVWRQFDAQRRELTEGTFRGGTGGEPASGITGQPVLCPRRRRRPWK
jgi:hypothetical protein